MPSTPSSADGPDQQAAGERKQPSGGARMLAIYLNDHLAGATAGLELFRRAAQSQKERAAALAALAREVAEDREALTRIMADLGVPADQAKVALGWLSEKAARLKPNGHLLSRSPLSDLLELESMLLGVRGKAACWRSLRALADTDPRLHSERLDTLLERAESQTAVLEDLRVTAAAHVFSG